MSGHEDGDRLDVIPEAGHPSGQPIIGGVMRRGDGALVEIDPLFLAKQGKVSNANLGCGYRLPPREEVESGNAS